LLEDELVDRGEFLEQCVGVAVRAGNELELRFAEVGGDVRMGERGAERGGMRRERERAIRGHAQAFLLHAAQDPAQPFAAELVQLHARAKVARKHTGWMSI